MKLKSAILLQEIRNSLVELEFYGYIIFCDKNKNIHSYGETQHYHFFHRSCAKPLQASIIQGLMTKDYYNLSEKEIAVCCASHTGEPVHLEILRGILKKANLTEKDLLCPAIEPLNKEEQKKFEVYSPLHNNCSGKHTIMLAICRQMGWDTKNYLDINHPLQKMIYKKIQTLCEEETELPATLDGCGAPIWATSLEGLTRGFYNLFCTEEYPDIKNSMQHNPYLIGGKDRPDTQIMELNQDLIAKAGAGGILCIANTRTKEVLTVKLTAADMRARSIIAIETMIKLDWINKNKTDINLLDKALNKKVLTETNRQVGEYVLCDAVGEWIKNLKQTV